MSDGNQQLNDADYDGFQGTTVLDVTDSSSLSSNILSFTRILQHWAASTNQKKSHLTYLLQLLKEHKTLIDFDTLPASGNQLMFIDGRDMPQPFATSENTTRYVLVHANFNSVLLQSELLDSLARNIHYLQLLI